MAKKYFEHEIINMCKMASKNMNTFYAESFINYSGTVKQGEKYYTEIIAKWLIDNYDCFEKIKIINRTNSYKLSHDGEIKRQTCRVEEITAKQMYNTDIDYKTIGRFIDYQTPLKDRRDNEGVGKIDLLSVNHKQKCVYILELKKADSPESMLRCVLECQTYLRQVCKEKLFKSFEIIEDYALKAAPLVYKGSQQYREYIDKSRENLHLLMDKLDCKPFFIEEKISYDIKDK